MDPCQATDGRRRLELLVRRFDVAFYGVCAVGRMHADDTLRRAWPYVAALAVPFAPVE